MSSKRRRRNGHRSSHSKKGGQNDRLLYELECFVDCNSACQVAVYKRFY